MTFKEIEQEGFERGYYEQAPQPPTFFKAIYMRGFWDGRHVRAEENRRMETLYRQWEAEDAAEAVGRR